MTYCGQRWFASRIDTEHPTVPVEHVCCLTVEEHELQRKPVPIVRTCECSCGAQRP